MQFKEGLKEMKRKEYSKLPKTLKEIGTKIHQVMLDKNRLIFANTNPSFWYCLSVNDSFLSNKDIILEDCRSEAQLELIGDAYLAFKLQKELFVTTWNTNKVMTREECQNIRSRITCNTNLAKFHDAWFPFRTMLTLDQNVAQSMKQKADFVEALIGLLSLCNEQAAIWLCYEIFEFGKSTVNY